MRPVFAGRFRKMAEAQRAEARATDGPMWMIYSVGGDHYERLAELTESTLEAQAST